MNDNLSPMPEGMEPSPVGPLNRCTAQLMLHRQLGTEPPTQVEALYEQPLECDEETWTRRIKLTTEPKRLDLGWLEPEQCGDIVIQALRPEMAVKPTEEEAQAILDQRIYVRRQDGSGVCKVRVGKFSISELDNPEDLWVSCKHGTAAIRVTIIPV